MLTLVIESETGEVIDLNELREVLMDMDLRIKCWSAGNHIVALNCIGSARLKLQEPFDFAEVSESMANSLGTK